MKTRQEFLDDVTRTLKSGVSSVIGISKSFDSDMRKGRGANRNPYLGRVWVVKLLSSYACGTSYVPSVVAAANNCGANITATEVIPRANWQTACEGELGRWFDTDKRTHSNLYLHISRNKKRVGHKVVEIYYLDGHLATPQEIENIMAWVTPNQPSTSATQTECGVDDEHLVEWKVVNIENILFVKQGENIIMGMASAPYVVDTYSLAASVAE